MTPPRLSCSLIGLARYEARRSWVYYMSRSNVNRRVTAGVRPGSCVSSSCLCAARFLVVPVVPVNTAILLKDGPRRSRNWIYLSGR